MPGGAPSIHDLPDPEGYRPVHLYLIARHGTRWPTPQRAAQITELESVLRVGGWPAHSGAAKGGMHTRRSECMAALAAPTCLPSLIHAERWDAFDALLLCCLCCLAEWSRRSPHWWFSYQPNVAQLLLSGFSLVQNARAPEHAWCLNWTSPFRHASYAAGELHPVGAWRSNGSPISIAAVQQLGRLLPC